MTSALLVAATLLAVPNGPATGAADRLYPSHLMVDQEVSVSSRITGVIEKIHVERGATVARGQPLCTLELREFDEHVHEAKEDMELKKAELERARALSAGGVSSRADLDEKRARHAVAVATWEKAKAIRDYAVIRAPFAGMVTEKSARTGQKVVDVQNVSLFKITAFEPLLARIYLPERELLNVRRGETVEVVPVHFPQARTTGTIEFISPTVDAASGTFQVIVHVRRDPSRNLLRPGLAVQVRLSPARER